MSPSRDNLRRAFLSGQRWERAEILPLKPDASFRRYLRLRQNNTTAMLMDAPPPMENAGAFVAVTRHLKKIGVRVPAIYAADEVNGFVLLEDLGDQTFTRLLAEGHDETALYRQAVRGISQIHRHPEATAIDLPAYDTKLALSEASLLPDWYLPARLERPLAAGARAGFQRAWASILGALPEVAPTLVLRDYHVDNLMLCGGDCAVLDYQDAVIGSPAYDLASLLQDARRNIAPALAGEMMRSYLAQNRGIDRDHLRQHYLVWATHRHCKVAGIFVRLWLRDGKAAYLRHLPRVMRLLQSHLHEPALQPLRHWLGANLGEINHPRITAPAARLLRHCNTG